MSTSKLMAMDRRRNLPATKAFCVLNATNDEQGQRPVLVAEAATSVTRIKKKRRALAMLFVDVWLPAPGPLVLDLPRIRPD
jgi:hypothetical protein